ncbi:hypothetical protein [Streptomyces albidus (ex Kaewkla and Franco 2022)]|uniref:hypothetical protein n=1 Tax=Streptomyces albidus (ex Kaewkla and Franco 2022) TaxID=722709 RepID=UPI0015EEA578|nr:hypothetical protein [Streptomyces albidus (ex Kaewkla and Franco 2022)]
MTAENDGTGATPEGDDPFAYLYRQQGGEGSPAPQTGTPRRSYNQVRAVGERQYGSQYGSQYGAQRTQQTTYGQQQPNAHYAAPETMPGGRAAAQHHSDGFDDTYGGGRGSGGRNRNGLLVGAIAVVAAVVIGIGAAIYFNSDDPGSRAGSSAGAGAGKGKDQNKPGKPRKGKTVASKQDAASLALAGGASLASDVPNAQGSNGSYVAGMNNGGASATWTVDDVPKAGIYTFFVRYGVPGHDADSTLTINGQPRQQPLNMSNFGDAEEGDWAKGWTETYAWVDLKQGQNTFKISCEQGNKCDFNLDQVWLKAGKLKR